MLEFQEVRIMELCLLFIGYLCACQELGEGTAKAS